MFFSLDWHDPARFTALLMLLRPQDPILGGQVRFRQRIAEQVCNPSLFLADRKSELLDWDYSSLASPLMIATASSVVSTSFAMNRKFTRAAA